MSEEINDLIESKKHKRDVLLEKGIEPYGRRFEKDADILNILEDFSEGKTVKTAGRVVTLRAHGKSVFADLKDLTGKMQIYLKADVLGREEFELFSNTIDIGAIIGVEGELFQTRTGEKTLNVKEYKILSKSIRPLPEKWHGLKDVEMRYRRRYLDLIVNENVDKIFIARSKIIKSIRKFLDSRAYIEVETPMMQPMPGGARGEPFKTHHNALDIDLYMRLAPELYLKRLLVGGLERVYEINRSFRNEGLSTRHNPEFTMLEVYAAYADYNVMMDLTEELITMLAEEILGTTEIEYQGKKLSLKRPWKRWSFADAMKNNFGINPEDDVDTWLSRFEQAGKKFKFDKDEKISRSQVLKIIEEMFEPEERDTPIFVVDYFSQMSPLAKSRPDNPLIAERFELFIGGFEVANAYSELNDPKEQKKRFEEQLDYISDADEINKRIDSDYVTALEYGMPPAGGLGIGIDRLVMLLTNQPSIKDVILFPQMKAES